MSTKNNIANITVKEVKIGVMRVGTVDYISLTDLAKYVNQNEPSGVIRNWMSNKDSFEYYGLWEEINNKNFNSVQFHIIKRDEAPYNRFTMTPTRFKKDFNAIGIIPSAGKYSVGVFAHPDIAFEFASWLSPEFKLYLIREFERLKEDEQYKQKLEWRANRLLAKANYLIQTDAIKNNIKLAKTGNIRDYADLFHLIILNNLESINAELIKAGLSQTTRLVRLNEIAREQMRILIDSKSMDDLLILK